MLHHILNSTELASVNFAMTIVAIVAVFLLGLLSAPDPRLMRVVKADRAETVKIVARVEGV